MSDRLLLPGQSSAPEPERVHVSHTETVLGTDGRLYEMRVEGSADLVRGPLGRFIDLAAQIEAEGERVPPEIRVVLDTLTSERNLT